MADEELGAPPVDRSELPARRSPAKGEYLEVGILNLKTLFSLLKIPTKPIDL